VNFIDRSGIKHSVKAEVGDSLLDIIINEELDFESFGVCDACVSCSTCHVILEKDVFEQCEEPYEDEYDMLDLASGLTETSRLGCQVFVTKDMDGMTATLPSEITDARQL